MDKNENINCVEKKNRVRGENWTQDEKDMFIEIMRQSAPIIENKQTDTNTNKKKNLEWVKIQNKLKELSGTHRDIPQLKGLWRRTKLAAKKTVSEHRRAVRATGGGQQPPSPSPNDVIIMDLCPTDFVVEENKFDSDANSPFMSQNEIEKVHNSTVIYDIEVNEDIENEPGVSFVEEIVTVTDVHNNEVKIKSVEDATSTKIKPQKSEKQMTYNIKTSKAKDTSKAAIVEANRLMKQRAMALMEEEYALKINFQKQEIAHQQLRHKLEMDLLLLEKEKNQIEIELLKKNCNNYVLTFIYKTILHIIFFIYDYII